MSIEFITEKIINDAIEYSDGVIYAAIVEAEGIIADAMREADAIREGAVARSVKDTTAIINKQNSAAELEARKMRLAAKQKEFSAATEAAIDRIVNMDQKDYIAFLAGTIAETGIRKGEICLNARDRKAIGKKLVKAANGQIKKGKFRLSDRIIESKGGFLITGGDVEIDSTLETRVLTIKDSIAARVVSTLFQT